MNFLRLSQFPFHGAGPLAEDPGSWDDQQVMAATVVRFTPPAGPYAGQDLFFLYYRGANALLSGKGKVSIGVMIADPARFTGMNWNKLRALNPIIPHDFVAEAPVGGGDYNDMTAVVHGGMVRLYVNIYGNPAGTNRMVMFELPDGITPRYRGEIEWKGRGFGRTGGLLVNVGETLWMMVGDERADGGSDRRLRRSDDGLTWRDGGAALRASGDPGAWDGYSLVVGRGFRAGSHIYAVQPGMPFIGTDRRGKPLDDWPEAIGIWRCHVNDLGNGRLWQAYPRNPVMLRGPTEGGCWQLTPMLAPQGIFGPYQTWAMPGWENIGTPAMNRLRTEPYAGLAEGWSTKHQYMAVAVNRLALDDWAADPIPAGRSYMIRHVRSGRWLKREGAALVLAEPGAPGAAAARFHLSARQGFRALRAGGPKGPELGVPGRRPDQRAGFDAPAADGLPATAPRDWLTEIFEINGRHDVALITNRHSSLSLAPGGAQEDGDFHVVQRPALAGDTDMLFEFLPLDD